MESESLYDLSGCCQMGANCDGKTCVNRFTGTADPGDVSRGIRATSRTPLLCIQPPLINSKASTGMDSFEATNHEPMDSNHVHQTNRPAHSHMDVSMQSNNIAAGRDAIFNITAAADAHLRKPFADIRTLANWVSPLNHHKVHKDILERVAEGTGSWIFEHPMFKDWLAKKKDTLSGSGIPGAGKTCLTSIVIQHLIKHKHATVIYIYCQYNDQLSVADILACMLKQMIERSQDVAQYVSTSLYEDCLRTETKPSKSELLTTLRGAAQQLTDLFLVVDGLDELRDDVRPELINDLLSLQQSLFTTSRPLSDVPILKDPDFTIRAPDHVLFAFISTKVACIPKLESHLQEPGVRDNIITKIHNRCDGMFLLATLQINELSLADIIDAESLHEDVNRLPTSLDDRYGLTLERIRSQGARERSLACRAILLVTNAERVLAVDELLAALTIDVEAGSVYELNRHTTKETLIRVCMGLLTIEKESRTVQLIHYTAQKYFETCKDLLPGDPHTFIADVSAIYLCHALADPQSDPQNANSSYPFYRYAYSHLGHHTYHASNEGKGQIPESVGQLFRKRPNVPLPLALLGAYIDHVQAIHFAALHGLESLFEEHHEDVNRNSALECSPLFYACLGGHTTLAERIIRNFGASLNPGCTTKFGATALHAASRSGQLAIVELLFPMASQGNGPSSGSGSPYSVGNMDIDVNAKMSDGRTALYLASENGYEAVVEALLGHMSEVGPNIKSTDDPSVLHSSSPGRCGLAFQPHRRSANTQVNAKDRDGWAPLHVATRNGHIPIIQLFLNSPGVEVNATTENGWTALHLAARYGHEAVSELLLNTTGIGNNAQTKDGQAPLHQAAHNGHELVVRLLLNSAGIEVNTCTKDGWTPLHFAALKGHESVAQLLLDATGIEVNTATRDGWTALYIAAFKGNDSVARLLLNFSDMKVNARTENGWTPLHISARNGHNSVIQLLLNSARIEVNATAKHGQTPLHLAAKNGHELVVQMLLGSRGIKVNAGSKDGWTPLHLAAENGHVSVVQLLLYSARAEVNSTTREGWTPLYVAAKHGHESVARLLLSSASIKVNAKARDGWMPLHIAAENGHSSVAQLLLSFTDIEVNAATRDGRTPLHIAVRNGHKSVVHLLLNTRGIKVNAVAKHGQTALHLAARYGHKSVAHLLLNSTRIVVNPITTYGGTPLHDAARNGHESVIQLLLGSPDIEVNAKTNAEGWTPLHQAGQKGHESAMRLLLGFAGIEVNAKTKAGCTALHLAAHKGHEGVIQLLLNSTDIRVNSTTNDSGWTPLYIAANEGHESVVRVLINSRGIDVSARAKDSGRTALHIASQKGYEGVVRLILSSPGVDINAGDPNGWTALHLAAQSGHELTVQRLLTSAGIRVNAKTNDGRTSLYQAAQNGHHSAVRLLLNAIGINVNTREEEGWTPLHIAAQNGHDPVVQLLLGAIVTEVNATEKDQWTPLHLAASVGHESVVHSLLNSTAIEVNAREIDGWTPLHLAAQNGHESVVRSLLGFNGIDAHARGTGESPWDKTPLEAAKLEGQRGVVVVFEEMSVGVDDLITA